MKTKVFVVCMAIITTLSVSACEERAIMTKGESASESIGLAQSIIPEAFSDNSSCTSPIVSCDEGFEFDESGEYCIKEDVIGDVNTTLSIKSL